MKIPQAPLFNDPIFDGVADPVVFWNHIEREWWMVYTQRRATSPRPDVSGIHGSDLGVASSPDGHNWLYRGTLNGLEFEPGRNTWWAPEIIFVDGVYHMYASYVRGMPINWQRPRQIIHYTATNPWHWKFESVLDLGYDRVIDACVVRTPTGLWRMWYKNESDHSNSHYADSHDLYNWAPKGQALVCDAHEGANVFKLGGKWWYICDMWRGLAAFRGDDCENWEFCGMMLAEPGRRDSDGSKAHHADVVVQGNEAYIFYFTHPQKMRTAVQVARLTTDGKTLHCDRDEPFHFELLPLD